MRYFFLNRSSLYGVSSINGWKFVIKKKNGNRSLMDSFKMAMNDVEFIEEVQINYGVIIESCIIKDKLTDKAFNVENCCSLRDFVILIKMDFPQENYIKRRLFEQCFENMDCPSLTKCYMRCITLGQTFSDVFLSLS